MVALAGILIALMLSSRVLGAIRTMGPPRRVAAPAPGAVPALGAAPQVGDGANQMDALSQPASTVEQLGPQVTNPAMTARVVRSWLKEG